MKPSMLTTRQAMDWLLERATPQVTQARDGIERVSTLASAGRVLAADLVSGLDVPPMDNTAMDGYAVRAADCATPGTRLPVTQRIPAGHVGAPLQPGSAARIFTGAMVPAGADAIVPQEQTERIEGSDDVVISIAPRIEDWIRRAGCDIRNGDVILPAGHRMRPQDAGLAASVGLADLPVARRLKVAAFFTGDELAMPGEPLRPGAIYNSNRFTLRGLIEGLGCELTDFGIVPDNLPATRDTLRRAAAGHDLIVTSGGVSVGEEDHIKPAVDAEGHLDLWQIAVKPGKPLAYGTVRGPERNAHFIGLPGNPVSSFVTFILFVRPFILRLSGVSDVEPRAYTLRADFDWSKPDRRNEFLRARLNADGGLDLFHNQNAAVLSSTVWGEGLVDCPPGQPIQRGQMVRFIPFSELL